MLSSSQRLASFLRVRYQTSFPLLNVTARNLNSINTRLMTNMNQTRSFSSELPYHLVVGMPALSPTMESGTIASWNVKEGDEIGAGDSIADIETDKATISFEAQDEAFVAKILVDAGTSDIKVGDPIMVTVEEEESVAAFKDFVVDSQDTAPPTPSQKPAVKEIPPIPKAAAPTPKTAAPAAPTPIVAAPAATSPIESS